jgi:hypothetical protein
VVWRKKLQRGANLPSFSHDFEQRRSFDLGPPPGVAVPTLTVSADGTRLIFEHGATVIADSLGWSSGAAAAREPLHR